MRKGAATTGPGPSATRRGGVAQPCEDGCGGSPSFPAMAVRGSLLRRWPHLPAFFPGHDLRPAESCPDGAVALVLDGVGAFRRPPGLFPGREGPLPGSVLASEGPWRAARFGRRHAPVALLATVATGAGSAALTTLLAAGGKPLGPPDPPPPDTQSLIALLREARVGGPAGLPDPGPAGLGLPRGEAVLLLDPCDPARAATLRALLAAARAGSEGRPVLLAEDPGAPQGAAPTPVAEATGLRRLPGRLAPWTLLDLAQAVHAPGGEGETVLLAYLAGLPTATHAPTPWSGMAPEAVLAALARATRCADPFRARPWTLEQAIRQLADWRVAEAENRRIVACTGIEWFKLGRIRAALASSAAAPRIVQRGSDAIRLAHARGGAVGVWASVMPPGLPARCAAAGVPLVRLEDGFVRSAGLGVRLAPAASMVRDGRGIHYDPAAESDLEHLLSTTRFDAALLARARRLREALTVRGITKYNLGGAAPELDLPPGRRAILVPGQVEDDAAIRRGAGRVRTNLDLLRAVRAENPDAIVLFKPHPDVEAGMRAGAVPAAETSRLADRVLSGVPIAGLYAQVGEVHTIGSLAGFEALLRGLRVVTWGRPFYAGWGLTEDRDPLAPSAPAEGAVRRRWDPGGALELDALVAAALILHPRCLDPVTGLPCPPELLLERLAAVPSGAGGGFGVPAPLRALTARVSRFLAEWWAAR